MFRGKSMSRSSVRRHSAGTGKASFGFALATASLLAFGAGCLEASADEFPVQPIHVVVPVPPGSAPDFLSRIFGASLQQQWGQPIIVDNKPGASQNIGAEFVARVTVVAQRSVVDGQELERLLVENPHRIRVGLK